MSTPTRELLSVIGFEVNQSKSTTNVESCSEDAKLLGEHEVCKYLGILEDRII